MCVGDSNGYEDFEASKCEDAMKAMTPGSAIGFNRIGFTHLAIFLGFGNCEDNGEMIPLICHFSGESAQTLAGQPPSIRLEDYRTVVQGSTTRVYKCSCNAFKRAKIILDCLQHVGETGYNLVSNNCEHFVRQMINGKSFSPQVLWTFLVPLIMLPLRLIGSSLGGSTSTSKKLKNSDSSGVKFRSLELVDPENDVIRVDLGNNGLEVKCVLLRPGRGLGIFVTRKMQAFKGFSKLQAIDEV